jgi:hypothetical protein
MRLGAGILQRLCGATAVSRSLRIALAVLLFATPGYASRMQRLWLAAPVEVDAEPVEETSSSTAEEEYADASKNCSRWGRCVRIPRPVLRIRPSTADASRRHLSLPPDSSNRRAVWAVSRLLC